MQVSSKEAEAEAFGAPLRADARRNRERVLEGARAAFAASGFEASYHEIAHLTGVGVGTVYRRYPQREALVQAVLLDILDELTAMARAACAEADAWAAFAGVFSALSAQIRRHAGLSERLDGRGGRKVAEARRRLLDAIEALLRHALQGGLRPDVGWRDILFLAQAAAAQGCGLGVEADDDGRARALAVILDGLRTMR